MDQRHPAHFPCLPLTSQASNTYLMEELFAFLKASHLGRNSRLRLTGWLLQIDWNVYNDATTQVVSGLQAISSCSKKWCDKQTAAIEGLFVVSTPPPMLRTLFGCSAAAVLATSCVVPVAEAETRKVFCHLNVKSPVIKKTQNAARCQFSQFQGNAYVIMYPGNRSPLEFEFPTNKQNVIYERKNHDGGIKFTTPYLTLKVFWADPGTEHRF